MAAVVVDANVIVQASIDRAGLGPLEGHELVAPPIMPSEAMSALHELGYRGEISSDLARLALDRMSKMTYDVRHPSGLFDVAWRIANDLGWAKTYDAEYVALAQMLDLTLVTLDGRLIRGARRHARIVAPGEI